MIVAPEFDALSEVLPGLVETLAGQVVGRLLPRSRVIKAFDTVSADRMRPDRTDLDGRRITLFLAGDDASARATAAAFARQIGFAPLDCGPLKASRYLEAMAHLNIILAVVQRGGTDAALLYHRAT